LFGLPFCTAQVIHVTGVTGAYLVFGRAAAFIAGVVELARGNGS